MIEPPGYVVRIEQAFDAPREVVFDTWTSPEVLRRCMPYELPRSRVLARSSVSRTRTPYR